jgi:hypothetical protein
MVIVSGLWAGSNFVICLFCAVRTLHYIALPGRAVTPILDLILSPRWCGG